MRLPIHIHGLTVPQCCFLGALHSGVQVCATYNERCPICSSHEKRQKEVGDPRSFIATLADGDVRRINIKNAMEMISRIFS